MKSQEIIAALERRSPASYAEEWDRENVGLQVGDRNWPVHKVYLAVDATEEVVADAIAKGADMLVTHHPMIFGGIRKINADSSIGRRILQLVQHQVTYFAIHTNYDVRGMAECAAKYMGLEDSEVLEVTCIEPDGTPQGIGRYGELRQPVTLADMAEFVKQRFSIDAVKVFGNPQQKITTIAISPGAGKNMVGAGFACGADVLITGDIDHHTGIDAVDEGMAIIDAGHYGIEHIFVADTQAYLQEAFGDAVEILCEPHKQTFWVV